MVKNIRFVPGLELARVFYTRMVRPVLDNYFPGLRYSAGLIGGGSEVLGFDDAMSRDHHWGPRLMVFLKPSDMGKSGKLKKILSEKLPHECLGYPVNFSSPDPADKGVQLMKERKAGPVNHRVEFFTIRGFSRDYLGFDAGKEPEPADWMTFPQQKLAGLTAGGIFRDDLGIEKIRKKFRTFPRDVRLYLMAACWRRIGQEEHLMGRAGLAGDELGSALIASRLVRDIMNLCFLLEQKYAPYPKWFGSGFRRLACGGKMESPLKKALAAGTWRKRERYLMIAMGKIAVLHNKSSIAGRVPKRAGWFWDRPFRVYQGERIASTLLKRIKDPRVKKLAARGILGSVDTISDNTDLLCRTALRPDLKRALGG